MAAPIPPLCLERNVLVGSTDFTLQIGDLKAVDIFVGELLDYRVEEVARITGIEIEYGDDGEAEDAGAINGVDQDNEDAQSTASAKSEGSKDSDAGAGEGEEAGDEVMRRLCGPVVRVMDAIEAAGGSLQRFVWTSSDGFYGTNGVRPKEFWQSLYRHARTLQYLTLGFFTHEVSEVLAPEVAFPALKKLNLDATTAHGDDGTAIEKLMQGSSNLEELRFSWPSCDLDSCQIKNITWEYTFPHLCRLEARGWDFAPKDFAAFLERCTEIEVFADGADRFGEDGDEDMIEELRLKPTTLPNLKVLEMDHRVKWRSEKDWFNEEAGRSIRHLRMQVSFSARPQLDALGKAGKGIERIRVLEIDGNRATWRQDEPDSDDEEDLERDVNSLNESASALKELLPKLKGLQELCVGMESSCILSSHDIGPRMMCEQDLERILGLLPREGGVKALRVWDTVAESLPPAFLDDVPGVPDSLEYLAWEGKEKKLYKLERVDGKVRAVECEALRTRKEGDWTDETVL